MRIRMLVIPILLAGSILPCYSQRLMPDDLEYLGAFRLPEGSGGSTWEYSGYGMTFCPIGDPGGPADGYPGSLFAIGHDQDQYVSEISIPVPMISANKNLDDLASAAPLQLFADITGGMFGPLEIPRAGLAILPPQGNQTSWKLHFCWGQHNQFEPAASHGWCELNLSDPRAAGPWFFGSYTNYVTNDYLFEISPSWSEASAPGMRLACGRFRDGGWGGLGPTLFAFGPWLDGNPPEPGESLTSIVPLLMYGIPQPGMAELAVDDSMKMSGYRESDEWSGGAWITSGEKSAVVFAGSKGLGNCWYGFSDGTVWPEGGPYPPVPPFPHDQRGWWSDSTQAQLIFYDPLDFSDVVDGKAHTWDPQPYAVLNLDPVLFDPGYDYPRYKKFSVGDIAFDRDLGLLYVMERRADEEKNLVHAWKVKGSGTSVRQKKTNVGFRLFQNFPNPFNGMTTFAFDLEKPSRVGFAIFNAKGTRIRTLQDKEYGTGRHQFAWDGKDDFMKNVPSGIYIYYIVASGHKMTGKMTLIR